MSRLLKFDDFENGRRPKQDPVTSHVPRVTPAEKQEPKMQQNNLEEAMKALVWKGVMESSYFTSDEKVGIYRTMKFSGIDKRALNESILTRMREALPKMREAGTEVKEETIDKLEKVMKSASAFSKYLADLLMKAWDRALGFYKSKLDPAKNDIFVRFKQMRGEGKDLNNNVNAEITALREIVMFWLKQFPSNVSKAIMQNYSRAIMKESMEVSADIHTKIMKFSPTKINEEDSALWAFMDEITDQLKNADPFKSVSSVRSIDVAPEKFSEAFVKYTADAGGPNSKITFQLLPMAMEEVVKHKNATIKGAKEQILKSEGVLKFLPMNIEILTIIEALAVAVVSMEAMIAIKDANSSVYKK